MSDPTARERLADVLRQTWHGEPVGSTDQYEWDAVAAYVLAHFVPVSTDATARPRVAGRCPSCRGASLFLGSGGHVTCSRLDCPAPGAVDDQLHGEQPAAADELAEAETRARRAVAGRSHVGARTMALLVATLDGLGHREHDAARAEVERLRDLRRQLWQAFGRPDGVGLDVELVDAVADAVQSGRAARAELERLRGELERAQAEAIRLRPIERRARDIHRDGTDHGRAVARVILGLAG